VAGKFEVIRLVDDYDQNLGSGTAVFLCIVFLSQSGVLHQDYLICANHD
jgi:hypothetical protein